MDAEQLIKGVFYGIFEKALIREIATVARLVPFQEGDVLIETGRYIKTMPLLITGAIKIMEGKIKLNRSSIELLSQ